MPFQTGQFNKKIILNQLVNLLREILFDLEHKTRSLKHEQLLTMPVKPEEPIVLKLQGIV